MNREIAKIAEPTFSAYLATRGMQESMSPTRRDFLKYTGAAGLLHRLERSRRRADRAVAERQSAHLHLQGARGPRARRGEARRLQLRRRALHAQRQHRRQRQRLERSVRGAAGGGGSADSAAGAADAAAGRRRAAPADAPGAAGFGVRVIHSGVWGFASSPIVNEDEIKRITRIAAEVARASAVAKKIDVKLAPVPAYTEYWSSPIKKDPARSRRRTSRRSCRRSSTSR